jgi:hypothetical protein
MAIRRRVNEVLADWCGVSPDDQTIGLETLWISTRNNPDRPHNGIDFQPDGVQDLRDKLIVEFKKPGNERKRVSVLKANSFKPNGDIETVNDLVRAVLLCPNLQPTS